MTHLIPDNIELSKDRVPKNVPYKHITYADHHNLVREYRALAAELKDLMQYVIGIEKDLALARLSR